jgi:putative heme-binding domain-containing protein
VPRSSRSSGLWPVRGSRSSRETGPRAWLERSATPTSSLQDPSAKPALEALRKLADDVHQPSDIRLAALAASPDRSDPPGPELFTFLISQTSPDRPVSARLQAVDVLTRSRLSEAQSLALAGVLAQAGPVEAGRLLEAFDRAEGEAVGLTLVEALKRSPARASFRVETLRPRLARFGAGTLARAEPLFAAIEAETLDRRSRFEALLSQVSGGDIRRGQAVFNSPKAACASCHAIGYVGGKLGPDLTKVGQIREVRDLLESIVEPSASFVRGYEPVAVATRDGKVVSGLLRKDSEDEVVVAVSSDRDERIPRSDVEEIRAGTVSVMPAGLDRQLSPAELADLVAFLKACR